MNPNFPIRLQFTCRQIVLWKNDKPTLVTDGSRDAEGTSIFIDGNDVWISGKETTNEFDDIATVWKNGEATYLTDGGMCNASANQVYRSGDDIIVVGDLICNGPFHADAFYVINDHKPKLLPKSSDNAACVGLGVIK